MIHATFQMILSLQKLPSFLSHSLICWNFKFILHLSRVNSYIKPSSSIRPKYWNKLFSLNARLIIFLHIIIYCLSFSVFRKRLFHFNSIWYWVLRLCFSFIILVLWAIVRICNTFKLYISILLIKMNSLRWLFHLILCLFNSFFYGISILESSLILLHNFL